MSRDRDTEANPTRIRLEASSSCQLRCPSCPTTAGAIHPAIGTGFLRLGDFRALLDANPQIAVVELSNYGEMFLNPELLGILRLAWEHGVLLNATNGVNLNHVKPEVLEGLVRYGLRKMTCSIDGATQESYEKYRIRGRLESVFENLAQINRFKLLYDSAYPELTWQFVVFGHNEHEIPVARQMARDLGMRFLLKLSWDAKLSPVQDPVPLRRELGGATRAEFRQARGHDYMQGICHQLWDEPQVNWDGKMLGCCRNFWGDFGANVFEGGLQAASNSERMRHARGMLLQREPPRADVPCSTCEIYLGMKADGKSLDRSDPALLQRVLRHVRRRLKRLWKLLIDRGDGGGPGPAGPRLSRQSVLVTEAAEDP